MKRFFALFCALVVSGILVAQQPAAPKITLKSVEGDVGVRRAGNAELLPAQAGMALQETDIVVASFGSAVIDFDGASEVTVESLTEIRIAAFTKADKLYTTRMQVRYGAIVAEVKSDTAPNDFTVATPNSTTAVEGTGYRKTSTPRGDRIRGRSGSFGVLAAAGPLWFAMGQGDRGKADANGDVTPPGEMLFKDAFGRVLKGATPPEGEASEKYAGRRNATGLDDQFSPGSPQSNLLNQTAQRRALDERRKADGLTPPPSPPYNGDGNGNGDSVGE